MPIKSTITKILLPALLALSLCAAAPDPTETPTQQELTNLINWISELEKPGRITMENGVMEIDVPAGATVWFKQPLSAPVQVRYEALAVSAGGPNDRVSDLNCFWMARDIRNPASLFDVKRYGSFAEYDQLQCYYVGLGGNSNTTTRFRRYIGQRSNRPLLPEHDLKEPLLVPNVWHTITLIADGQDARYIYDGKVIFDYRDAEPYTSGWFGLRTVSSHLRIRNIEISRPAAATQP